MADQQNDVFSSYSDASSIATLREADEIATFDLLNMPSPTAFKRTAKSPPRGVKEVMLSKQIRAMKETKHLGSSSSSQSLLPSSTYRDPLLPGVLRTTKPLVGTMRPDDATNKKQTGSLWQSVPNFAGLRLDGAPPLVPTPIHAFLASLEKPKVTIVNLGATDTRKPKEQSFDPGMEELRNYTALMDKFGLNQFMIYRGATLTGTPEFEGFRSKYNHDWGAITGVLHELEEFLRAREVKLAIINGPRLHEIASLNLPTVHRDDLISCISNIEEIKSSTTTGGKKVSMEKERGAATAIQARIRAFIGRRRYLRDKRRAVNAIIIQSYVRRMVCQRLVRDKMRLTKTHFEDQWDHNVDRLRATWHQLNQLASEPASGPASSSSRRKQRLVVMVPSISAAEYVRLSMDRIQTLQNMHIACLYQLVDPHVHIVYISPVQLTTDEATYHERFLAALGVHMPATDAKRLHFVVPELLHRLPSHMPLAQVLWYSTAALRKVKAFIKVHAAARARASTHARPRPCLRPYMRTHAPIPGLILNATSMSTHFLPPPPPGTCSHTRQRFPRAVMVPTAMSWVERRLSNLFNVPMLSADPVTAETIQSRSFLKKIFTDACVNVPIGAHDICSTQDFYLALPRLIASNIEVRRWIFRLNVDYNNEGYAYLDVDSLSVMASLRKEMLSLLHLSHGDSHGHSHGNVTGRSDAGRGHGDGAGHEGGHSGVGAWYNKQVQLDVRKRVMQCLRAEIAAKAVVCRKDLHGSWEHFERYFRQYGMVIEAEPLNVIGNVQGLCFIDPSNGHAQVGPLVHWSAWTAPSAHLQAHPPTLPTATHRWVHRPAWKYPTQRCTHSPPGAPTHP